MNIKTDGKISLMEIYNMPFKLRNLYTKEHNKMIEEKNKSGNINPFGA